MEQMLIFLSLMGACILHLRQKLQLHQKQQEHRGRQADGEQPLFPEHQAEIEQLSVFPDRIEELKVAGYDAVIWANKDNITQSKSGWGNDYPQYVVFDPAQIEIIRIDRNAEINESMEPIICYRGIKAGRPAA